MTSAPLFVEELESRWVAAAPVNSLPGTQATEPNTPLAFSATNDNLISISDPDGPGPFEVEISIRNPDTLLADAGTVAVSSTTGLTVTGNGTIDLVLIGALTDINTAISTLTYTPPTGFVGTARLIVESDDQDGPGGLSDTDFLDITVQDTTPPQVVSGSLSKLNFNKADVGTTLTVTYTLNEPMNEAINPTIVGNPDVSSSLILTSSTWTTSTTHTFIFTLANFDIETTTFFDISGAQDLAGNTMVPDTIGVGVNIDTVAPAVTINQAQGQADPTTTAPILFKVVFSEPVNGFTASDVSFTGSTAPGTLIASVSGSGANYTASISGFTGPGKVVVSIPAGAVTDIRQNPNLASTSTDNEVAIAEPAQPAPPKTDLFAVATGPGTPVQVNVFNADGSLRFALSPFDGFSGGATVATGDLTGDGVDDIVVGAAANGHVKVFDGATGAELQSFLGFEGFAGGVFVGAGDVTGDGKADVLVSAGAAAPHVKVFDGATGALVQSFLAFEGFAGGASVRAGDLNGDGFADIVVGAGIGGPPHIKTFDGQNLNLLTSFFAGDPASTSGVLVGVGDFVAGARPEVVGSVNGRVTIFGFNPAGSALLPYIEQENLVPFAEGIATGPAAIRLGDGIIAILIGVVSPGSPSHVKIIDSTSNTFQSFFAFDPLFTGGVSVG